jgi:hypothetical protein
MDDELQRAIRDACLNEDVALGALPPRIAIYRRLVRNTLSGVVNKLLERTRERMGVAFDDSFARFLEERGPRTHYLRDVPHEFVEWATPYWRDSGAAAWLLDLARHEMTAFGVSTAPHPAEPPAFDVHLDLPLLLSPIARIERYDFAIHEEFAEAPATRAVALLYYRDAEHALRTLELTPLAAALIERASMPLREAIAAACSVTAIPMNDDTLASIARLLADLGERGALLGAKAASSDQPAAR